jgi:hypothetical protein
MATKHMKELKDEGERASTWKSLDIVGSRKETLKISGIDRACTPTVMMEKDC